MADTPDIASKEFECAAAEARNTRDEAAYLARQRRMLAGVRRFFMSPTMQEICRLEDVTGRLLFDAEVDQKLRWKSGTAKRLAAAGELKHVTLPDGSLRFRSRDIDALIDGSDA